MSETSDEAILTNIQLKITNEGILKTSGNGELQKIIAAKIWWVGDFLF